MFQMKMLSGANILITGCSRGLGLEMVKHGSNTRKIKYILVKIEIVHVIKKCLKFKKVKNLESQQIHRDIEHVL